MNYTVLTILDSHPYLEWTEVSSEDLLGEDHTHLTNETTDVVTDSDGKRVKGIRGLRSGMRKADAIKGERPLGTSP